MRRETLLKRLDSRIRSGERDARKRVLGDAAYLIAQQVIEGARRYFVMRSDEAAPEEEAVAFGMSVLRLCMEMRGRDADDLREQGRLLAER